jgi:hypothetical protein
MLRAKLNTTRLVVGAYVGLVLGAVSLNAAHSWFWEREHDEAPVAAACLIVLLVALVCRRRWAWIILALFDAGAAISIPFTKGSLLGDAWALVSLALIVSPPMRAYVRSIRTPPYWQTRTTSHDGLGFTFPNRNAQSGPDGS